MLWKLLGKVSRAALHVHSSVLGIGTAIVIVLSVHDFLHLRKKLKGEPDAPKVTDANAHKSV